MDNILVALIVIGALLFCLNRFRRMGKGECSCEKGSCSACAKNKGPTGSCGGGGQ